MAIRLGSATPSKAYYGGTEADRLYLGADKVWERAGVPVISSFTVAAPTPTHVTVQWRVSGATAVALYETLAGGARTSIPVVGGSTSVRWRRPPQTAAYSLTCTNAAGTAVAVATLEV